MQVRRSHWAKIFIVLHRFVSRRGATVGGRTLVGRPFLSCGPLPGRLARGGLAECGPVTVRARRWRLCSESAARRWPVAEGFACRGWAAVGGGPCRKARGRTGGPGVFLERGLLPCWAGRWADILRKGSLGLVVFGPRGGAFFKGLGYKRLRSECLSGARTSGARRNSGQLAGVDQVAATDILRFWSAQLAIGSLTQQFQLVRIKLAQVSRLLVEDQWTVADAANLLHEVADFLEHFAQLAVAALDENHFIPGIVALADLADAGRRGANLFRAGLPALNGDARAQQVEFGFAGNPGHFHQIGFFHAGGGAGQAVGQLAVIGHQQQAFTHVVQAADRVEPLAHLVKELHHRGSALGVLDRGDKAPGLVEDKVTQALGALEQLAIDANMVAAAVGLGAQLCDDFAVDLHPALLNEFLGLAAAGDTGLGQDFLQAFELNGGARLRIELGYIFVFVRLGAVLEFGADFGCNLRFNRGFGLAIGFIANGIFDFGLRNRGLGCNYYF